METKLKNTYYNYQLTGENWIYIHSALTLAYIVDPQEYNREKYFRIIQLLDLTLLDDEICSPGDLTIIHGFLKNKRHVKKARRIFLKGFSKKLIKKITQCLKKR